jgi:hypothetical protein
MLTFTDDELKQQIQEDVGVKPHFPMESFSDLEADVRQSVARIQHSPLFHIRTTCATSSTRSKPAASARSAKKTKNICRHA